MWVSMQLLRLATVKCHTYCCAHTQHLEDIFSSERVATLLLTIKIIAQGNGLCMCPKREGSFYGGLSNQLWCHFRRSSELKKAWERFMHANEIMRKDSSVWSEQGLQGRRSLSEQPWVHFTRVSECEKAWERFMHANEIYAEETSLWKAKKD